MIEFDVIVGNPPYQVSTNKNGSQAKPIYHLFIEEAIKLNPKYISFITPSRWMTGGKGLDDFRKYFLNDKRIKKIIDFHDANQLFKGVDIKGGVNYFLWDRDYKGLCNYNGTERILNEHETFIRDNKALTILEKVRVRNEKTMDEVMSSAKFFGFRTFFNDYKDKQDCTNNIKLYGNKQLMKKTDGVGYVNIDQITKGHELINKYKVLLTEAYGGVEQSLKQVLGNPIIAEPNSVCSETYLVVSSFYKQKEAENMVSYIKTKFFRFLVSLIKNTQHGTKKVYAFVPQQDMSESWTDEKLYKKYNLTQEEIDYIESKIRVME